MDSPTPEYLVKEAQINDVLKNLVLPRGVSYEYGSSLESEVSAFAMVGVKTEPREMHTTRPDDVVNFYYRGKKAIGRVHFTKDPINVESLDGMFAETEASLRQKLGL